MKRFISLIINRIKSAISTPSLSVVLAYCSVFFIAISCAIEMERQKKYKNLNTNHIHLHEWRGGLNGWVGLREVRWFAEPTVASLTDEPHSLGAVIDALSQCVSIISFSFVTDTKPVSPQLIKALSRLPSLKSLSFYHAALSAESWAAAGSLSRIKIIEINQAMLSNSDLAQLGGITDLEKLFICSEEITVSGLKSLDHLSIKLIHLTDTPQIQESALAEVKQLFPSSHVQIVHSVP